MGFVVFSVEHLFLGLTPGIFDEFDVFPGEPRGPHRETKTGCRIPTAKQVKVKILRERKSRKSVGLK